MLYKTLILLSNFIFVDNVLANPLMCSMCTVAIASGLGIARLLGVSDSIVGIWLGAILLALSNWADFFLVNKRNVTNNLIRTIVYLSSYLLIIPLYLGKNPKICFNYNKIIGIDCFLFAVLCGSLTVLASIKLYSFLKNKNNGKPHFPYERVVLPIVNLLLVSLIFYLIGK